MNRRFFLKSGGVALASIGLASAAPSFLQRAVLAQGRGPTTGGRRKTLIAIFQRGAVDGLNMVVPHGEKNYYEFRPTLAIAQPKKGATGESVIDLDGFFGVHPALAGFKPIWDAKQLAIIHAVGCHINSFAAPAVPLFRRTICSATTIHFFLLGDAGHPNPVSE